MQAQPAYFPRLGLLDKTTATVARSSTSSSGSGHSNGRDARVSGLFTDNGSVVSTRGLTDGRIVVADVVLVGGVSTDGVDSTELVLSTTSNVAIVGRGGDDR